jgi:hypothetical protein
MPRKSAASLTAIPLDRFDRAHRLKPPDDLSASERELWLALVAGCPVEHFRSTDAPLLRQYVAMVCLAERAAAGIEASGPISDDGLKWVSVHQRATRAMAVLSMRLRLNPSARQTSRDVGRAAASFQPPSYYDLMRDGRA